MKPINIYALTRTMNTDNLQRLERQMSGRKYFLTVKYWEIESLSKLMEHLQAYMTRAYELLFFYSFQIQKKGKEFDFLSTSDATVSNIEIMSTIVPNEHPQNQLAQNKYYCSCLVSLYALYMRIYSENVLYSLVESVLMLWLAGEIN